MFPNQEDSARMVMMRTLDSSEDPVLGDYRDLTDVMLRARREPVEGIYIAESIKVLDRALRAGHRPISILTTVTWLDQIYDLEKRHQRALEDTPVYVGESSMIEALTGFHVHRGTLASMARPLLPSVAELISGARRIVVLENIVDHTNVGAVFRSVAGLGADAVIVSASCADPLYRRSVRVSMGTVMQVPWTRAGEWSELVSTLHEAQFTLAAMALGPDTVSLEDFAHNPPERLALVLGTEGDGVSTQALASADVTVSIPMHKGVDSLNVAAAGAVAMWALR
jgi:tRNA G18 (ribose-2'-O)-methylase SpoU